MPSQSPLIIAGMHRSGTSLAASLLQSAGVNLGHRLLRGDPGNVKGYFEDLDFIELHGQMLMAQGLTSSGMTARFPLDCPESLVAAAHSLIAEDKVRGHLWGWKDPRTTLFVEFWRRLLPQARFIFLFRPPWEVIDSLFRRGDEEFRANPVAALETWDAYNRIVLDFCRCYPQQSLLFNIHGLSAQPQLLSETMFTVFGVELSLPNADLYEAPLLHRFADNSPYIHLFRRNFPDVVALYQALNALAVVSEPLPHQEETAPGAAFLADWRELCQLRQHVKEQARQLDTFASVQAWAQELKAGNEWLQNQFKQVEQEQHTRQTQLEGLTTENEFLRLQNQQFQQERDKLVDWSQELQTGNDWLHSQLTQAQQEKTRLVAWSQDLKTGNEQLRSHLVQMQQKQDQLATWSEELKTGNEQLRLQLTQIQESKTQLIAWSEELQTGNNWLRSQLTQMEQKKTQLTAWSEELQTGNEWLRSQLTQMEQKETQLTAWSEELQTGNEWLRSQLSDVQRQKQQLVDWSEELQTANNWLKSQLNDFQNEREQLLKWSQELVKANDWLNGQIENLSYERDTLERQHNDLAFVNAHLTTEVAELIAEREKFARFLKAGLNLIQAQWTRKLIMIKSFFRS
ncbi:MAG: sulfotransferase [Cyanobacteria bacterium P01_H01_bin.15]